MCKWLCWAKKKQNKKTKQLAATQFCEATNNSAIMNESKKNQNDNFVITHFCAQR